jgi:hypothetical protein
VVAVLITLAAAAAALAETQGTSVLALMKAEIDPAANAFWAAGNDAPEGETAAAAAERWASAAQAAATLESSGKALSAAPHARDAAWLGFAQAMTQAAADGRKAAQARGTERAFEAGGRLYESCEGCHAKYIPGRG